MAKATRAQTWEGNVYHMQLGRMLQKVLGIGTELMSN
jgi:hypothetical protein